MTLKHRDILEAGSIEGFQTLAKTDHSARLTKIGETAKNMQSFAELEEI